MKLLTFRKRGEKQERVGGINAMGEVIDLTLAYANYLNHHGHANPAQIARSYIPPDMIEFINGGNLSYEAAEKALNHIDELKVKGSPSDPDHEKFVFLQEEIEFLPPIVRPGKMIGIGMNYADHLGDSGSSAPPFPMAFSQFPSCLLGHKGKILWTKRTPALDYEVELAFVIGKKGKYIKADEALDYVYGYTIYNDISERNLQMTERKLGIILGGKNMDTFAPLGPWIVTKNDVPDPHNLNLSLRVNGEIRQNSNTKHLIYNILDIISYWSNLTTLYPGDIFGTGTPSGTALGRKPSPDPYYLKPGDVVEAEIENLGILMNEVLEEGRN